MPEFTVEGSRKYNWFGEWLAGELRSAIPNWVLTGTPDKEVVETSKR